MYEIVNAGCCCIIYTHRGKQFCNQHKSTMEKIDPMVDPLCNEDTIWELNGLLINSEYLVLNCTRMLN